MVDADLNRVELWLLVLAFLSALLTSGLPLRRRAWPGPRRPVLVVFLAALLGRAALLLLIPVPVPIVHDEFSYLLQSDTFASGRLTNPTHPLWEHFESMHIFHQPTYQSMYPPVQGLILAMGQVIGHPWIGVWLIGAAACAAICWMLLAWIPKSWAFWGGMLAVLRFGLVSYWVNSYWGGAHAALGGALVLGAMPRVLRANRVRDSLLLGFGLAILANSRPYEGFLLAMPVGIWLIWKAPWRRLVPAALVLGIAALAMGYYFWRVTGTPFRMPYAVNRATYGWPATLPWMALEPVTFRHEPMRKYALWELNYHRQYSSVSRLKEELDQKALNLWSFYLGPSLTLGLLLCGRRLLRTRRMRFLLAAGLWVLLGVLIGQSAVPHYLAPITAALIALVMVAIRYLWRSRLWLLAPALPVILLVLVVVRVAPSHPWPVPVGGHPHSWCCVTAGNVPRSQILAYLHRQPGPQLVIVRYRPDHNFHTEWVYNEADIDHAKVVWAREMSPEANARLLAYFKDRRAVLLEADENPPRLTLFP